MENQNLYSEVWSHFLASQGAQLDEKGRVITFGNPEIEHYLIKHGPVVTSLSHRALLRVSGKDAFDFLQGQLTADLAEVNDSNAQFSAYCDPQGNVLAIFLVFKYQDDFYLSFEQSLIQSIQKRLQMFVLRSDVTLTDVRETLVHIGFAGEFGDLDVQRRLDTKIKALYECGYLQNDSMQDVFIIKTPGPYHRYELFGPAEQVIQAWQEIRINADVTNTQDWELLNIAAAVPSVNQATTGKFIAQFLNLDKFNAINFKKGCFPGQEIMARLHYRGKITKRMLRLRSDSVLDLSPGDDWQLQDDAGKTHKLMVINCGQDILQGSIVNAVATLRSLDSAAGTLKTSTGETITVEPLPYKITEED